MPYSKASYWQGKKSKKEKTKKLIEGFLKLVFRLSNCHVEIMRDGTVPTENEGYEKQMHS